LISFAEVVGRSRAPRAHREIPMTAFGHPLHRLREGVLPFAILRGSACVCRLHETVSGHKRTVDGRIVLLTTAQFDEYHLPRFIGPSRSGLPRRSRMRFRPVAVVVRWADQGANRL